MAQRSIVIDIGSGYTKVGFEGDEEPHFTIPTLMYQARKAPNLFKDSSSFAIGSAIRPQDFPNAKSPLNETGIIQDFDYYENYLKKLFAQMNLENDDLNEHPVLIPERPVPPKQQRQRIAQILFEKFNCGQMYVMNSSILGLYSSGRVTGVVLDVGHSVSHVVPLIDGYPNTTLTEIIPMGGRDVTDALRAGLQDMGGQYRRYLGKRSILEKIKEQFTYVVCNENENDVNAKSDFRLPDGKGISLTNRFRGKVGETLFNPFEVLGKEEVGIQETLGDVIRRSSPSLRPRFYSSIVLSGGGTVMAGFAKRMEHETRKFAPRNCQVEVVAVKQRRFGVWLGGTILSGLKQFNQMWIRKEEYNDWGPQAIDRKYF